MIRRLQRWWWARQRAVDLNVLWPQCKRLSPTIDHARAAFAVHAYSDAAWVREYGDRLADIIGELK